MQLAFFSYRFLKEIHTGGKPSEENIVFNIDMTWLCWYVMTDVFHSGNQSLPLHVRLQVSPWRYCRQGDLEDE